MSAPGDDLTVGEVTKLLVAAVADATRKLQVGYTTPDGHYPASAKVSRGIRISVRYNRHRQREVAIAAADGHKPISAAIIRLVSEAHRAATGAGLELRYTEPRDYPERGGQLMWAVMRAEDENAQPRLM